MAGKRKARQLVVPDIAEDAAERKRVLNILAQRRYRQRRKDRLHALESRTKGPSGHPAGSTHSTSSSSSASINALDNTDQILDFEMRQCPNVQVIGNQKEDCILPQITSSDPFLQFVSTSAPPLETDLSIAPDVSFWPTFSFWPDQIPQNEGSVDIFPSQSSGAGSNDRLDISTALQTSETSSFSFPDDKILEVPSLTLLNAATKVAHRLNLAHLIWDLTAISPFYRPRESSNVLTPPTPLGNSSTPASSSISASNDSYFASDSDHSDNSNTGSPDLTTLPPHLQPTQTQRLISHHPVLDLLPWPGTRDKLIQVFNLPEHLRPKNAQDPTGLMRLIYDMEDIGGEGIKVQSSDPFEAGGWEIGQVMFRRWWWAFEVGVIESSNRKRMGRGERVLSLG